MRRDPVFQPLRQIFQIFKILSHHIPLAGESGENTKTNGVQKPLLKTQYLPFFVIK